jgi:hypothetical protein
MRSSHQNKEISTAVMGVTQNCIDSNNLTSPLNKILQYHTLLETTRLLIESPEKRARQSFLLKWAPAS